MVILELIIIEVVFAVNVMMVCVHVVMAYSTYMMVMTCLDLSEVIDKLLNTVLSLQLLSC